MSAEINNTQSSDATKRGKKRKLLYPKCLDQIRFEMNIPEFTDRIISKTVNCGFMKWTFSFFNNQIHHDHWVQQEDKPIAKWRNSTPKRLKKLHRQRQKRKRQGYVLRVQCEMDPGREMMERNPNLLHDNLRRWKAHAIIEENWEGRKRSVRRFVKGRKKRPAQVFTEILPHHEIKHYPALICSTKKTLSIELRVLRIVNLTQNAFVKPNFEKTDQPDEICLSANNEHVFVKRPFLELHSPVFHEQIRRGIGLSPENPIQIDEQFTASLTRTVIRVIACPHQPSFFSSDIPELLAFAKQYKIGTLLGIIEHKLINKKCTKIHYDKKIGLADTYQLNGLINTFVQRMTTEENIEKKLKKKKLHNDFTKQLTRKLEAIREQKRQIELRKTEERAKRRKLKMAKSAERN